MKNKITSAWVVRRPDRTNLSGYSHRKFNTEEEARKFAEGKDNCEVYEQEDYNTPRLENYGWKKPVTSAHQDKMWRGVPGVEMIWHGEWSDPELEYEGTRRNYWDVEDAMYEWAKEDGIDTENDEEFNRYCQEHAYDVYECFSACGKKKGKRKPVKSAKRPIQSMIIHQEITFDDFEPWSGARDTYERIMKADLGDEFDALITELYPDGCTETQINDILWFDADWVYECLGMSKEDEDDDGIEPIDSGCHGKSKKGKKKAVKSSMSVRDLPREALQELKQRYYQEMTGDDLSYGEMAAIDDIVTDEEVFDEYDGTNFTEDDFFCLAK